MTSGQELTSLTVAELAERIRTKQVSPVEVAQAFVSRADALEPTIGAFVTRTSEQALEAARQAEAEIAAGNYKGPMHGIPVGVKDIYATAGVRTTSGSKVYADHVPDRDSAAVARLKDAGAYSIGKTGTVEFAFDPTGRNAHYGMPHNPWGLDRMPGGSSAGSGAGTAAGFFPISLGTDTGGSIRIPSALCGLTGIKPTFGLTSRAGVTPLSWSLDTVGPMARSAEDAAIALNVLAGYDPDDPASVRSEKIDYTKGLDAGIRGLRVGVPKEYIWDIVDPEVETAFRKAMSDLEELGATVEEISIPELEWVPSMSIAITTVEAAAIYGELARTRGDDLDPAVLRRVESGFFISGERYAHALRARALFTRRLNVAFEKVDVIATPTVATPAPPQNADRMEIGGVNTNVREALLRDTRIFNASRLPAVAMPTGFSAEGLPLSMQIAGPAFQDALTLRVAHAYQQATDWHTARAAVSP
ncbi:MAG: amidase [Chloroflexi bacterium]|nr:amidase [Chloroflexota bacterium]